jgi:hypothetical protein
LPPAAFAASAMRREGKQQQKMEPLLAETKIRPCPKIGTSSPHLGASAAWFFLFLGFEQRFPFLVAPLPLGLALVEGCHHATGRSGTMLRGGLPLTIAN